VGLGTSVGVLLGADEGVALGLGVLGVVVEVALGLSVDVALGAKDGVAVGVGVPGVELAVCVDDGIGLVVGVAPALPPRSRITPPAPPLVDVLEVLVNCALATPAAGAAV
jgi:hypothetical protein